MSIIGSVTAAESKKPLEIGRYTLDSKAKAFIDGDKLFQRHASLLGSTGSGKSWAVASILEQSQTLENVNIIVFDLHGEYAKLPYAQQLRIAGPGDLSEEDESVLFLPFWLLNYEEMQTLLVDHSEQSAPNQSLAVLDSIVKAKKDTLEKLGKKDVLATFTVDSPIPFKMTQIVTELEEKNTESIGTGEVYVSGEKKGQEKTTQGPLFNKLTRLLIRLKNKLEDRRYGFLFQPPEKWYAYKSLHELANMLMGYKGIDGYTKSGIKIIDFSEVPSDVLPVIVSLVARLVYQIQFWSEAGEDNNGRHPILLLCDEAHLYLPSASKASNPLEKKALENFERIAKEGRKYGVGLFIVSQRPSDVSTTILSQCNNIISLRLSNDSDKAVVKSLLPDSLTGLLDIIPGLEVGEGVIVGDSVLLPTRIILNKPQYKPLSATIDFWQCWDKKRCTTDLVKAVEHLRRQSRK
jgi:DNA helicase HerA-like ATPase